MKHVWILNHYAQEPGGPGGTRHYSLARHLPEHGWSASIIASSTEHNSGRQRLKPEEKLRLQNYDGVPFLWLRGSNYSGNGLDRMTNMLGYTRAALRAENLSQLQRPDAVIGSSVHPLAAWAGRRLAKRYNVPFLFEVRDLWPQTLIDMGRLSNQSPISHALRGLEKSLYKSAARIVVLLPRAGDYIEPLGIPRDKIVWISNGVELDDFVPAAPIPRDVFTLMYFGAHGGANGLDNVLRAMRIVQDDPAGGKILLRLIGDGPLKPALVAQAQELGLANIRFEDPVPKKMIPQLAAEADAFVICVRDLPLLYRYGVSMNKIFDYMAAARPTIIAMDAPNNPIEEAQGGLTVRPEEPAKLAAAILDMARLPTDERIAMGKAARRHVEEAYGYRYLAGKLASTLDSCVGKA
ncbi:glycosyltransferase family 4 protein [Mesorhizobium sp. SP-1A]|uniref:glycosyltransferase family 4 protein n=1 Tax=Mesorhizobium sp. SP-1A TaxID=3077840 RepID=UPI0028F74E8A|nr:glycosyltransferase family 4 protein [Mesorhizobium sp. SP-1A]